MTLLAEIGRDAIPAKRAVRPRVLASLVLMDAFFLGGMTILEVVQQFLQSTVNQSGALVARAEMADVLDCLDPLHAAVAGVTFLLVAITIGVWGWSTDRPARPIQTRIAPSK